MNHATGRRLIDALTARYRAVTAALTALALASPALADNIGAIGTRIAGQGQGVGNAITMLMYLGGLVAAGVLCAKIKGNRDNPQQHPLSHAAAAFVVMVALLYLPETFETGGDTIYGDGAAENAISGNTSIGGG